MKKTSILMAIFAALALILVGCGSNPAKPEESNQQTEQTQQQSETVTSNPETTISKDQPDKKATTEQQNPQQENKTEEQQTKPEPKEQQQEEKLYSEGEFDGKFLKCQLPDKWIAKEDPSQGYATIILDPAQNAGIGIQYVENNKDSAQTRAEGIANQFGCKIVDVKIGNYSYKRMTTKQKDPKTNKDVVFDYLICVTGSKAYYLATPIFNQEKIQSLIANFLFK